MDGLSASSATLSFRPPLTLEEVPIPPGYDRGMLDPMFKAAQLAAHQTKIRENLQARARINHKASLDHAYRMKVLEMCRRDIYFFIDHFMWTYDDRISTDEPMVLYEFQREKLIAPYLEMIETVGRTRWTGCVEKSRGVGFTWVELAARLWRWLFADNWSILIGAVTEDDVDDGGQEATHESLFGKLRYMLEHLPEWFREEVLGPYWKRDQFNKRLTLKHPYKPRNIIVGKHFGSMFGRGKRYSEVFGDEIAYAEKFKNADTSLKQTTNRFNGGSTPQGLHTFHAQLMKGTLKVVRRTMWWGEHPELDLEWYNEQREHMTDEAIAQELDINYEGSAGRRVLPEVTIASHFITIEHPNILDSSGRMVNDGTLYSRDLNVHAMIDPGISDALATIWIQEDPYHQEWRVVDYVHAVDKTIDWIVPFLLGRVPDVTYEGKPWPHRYNAIEDGIILRHQAWQAPSEVFGDHFGTTRSMVTGQSCYDVLAKYNIDVCPIRIENDLQALSYLQVWMRHVRISAHLEHQRNGPPDTHPTFSEVVSNWRYRKPHDNAPALNLKPVHDQYSHGGDCLKMYAQTVDLPEPSQMPVESGNVHRQRGPAVSVPRPYRPRR